MRGSRARSIASAVVIGAVASVSAVVPACSSEESEDSVEALGTDAGAGGGNRGESGASGDGATVLADGRVIESGGRGPESGAPATGPEYLYASGSSTKISQFVVDPASGAAQPQSTTTAFAANPSFLAFAPDRTRLYALAEGTNGRVGAYAMDQTGALSFLNAVSSQGDGPAHVAVDRTGKWVFVANYTDGAIAVLPVTASGLGDAVATTNAGANAHMMIADLTNQYVFVPCLGSDKVAQYKFDATSGALTPNTPPSVATANGAGPRHIALHPDGQHAYVINEKDSTMTAYSISSGGTLSPLETKSTLPAGFSGSNTCAEVMVHPSGKFLYGSNRGHDSIVVFGLAADGRMTQLSHTKTGGTTPRSFELDPAGAFLYAANQGSGTITTFKVDPTTGALSSVGAPLSVTAPSFVGIVRFP